MSSNSQVPSCIEWIMCIFCWYVYSFFRATTKTQNRGNPPFLFLLEIDSCRAATAGERDFFILRHGFLRGGIPIFLTVGLGGDREATMMRRQIHGNAIEIPRSVDKRNLPAARDDRFVQISHWLVNYLSIILFFNWPIVEILGLDYSISIVMTNNPHIPVSTSGEIIWRKSRKQFSVGAVESGAEGLYGRSQLHPGVTGCDSQGAHFAILLTSLNFSFYTLQLF